MREKAKEYQRRDVQPLLVMAQYPFQLTRPKATGSADRWNKWPHAIPAEVLFDPLSTASATYGVAFQTQFRGNNNVWSSRPATREFAAQALVLFADANTRPALERALADPKPGVRLYAIQALSMLGPLPRTQENERILRSDPSDDGVRPMMAAALERIDRPNQAELRKALADYDLRKMDSVRVGELAPDFTLADFTGKTSRLSQFRGKKTVVLRFILYDY